MTQAFGVRDTADILWLTRPRFIAHHIYVEGIEGATLEDKEANAIAKWNRDFANKDIVRRGTGLDTQLGVLGIPRTEGYRYRESQRLVTCTDSVHGATDMAVVMKELGEHGTTAQALTGRAMGEFGNVFVQGAASSSSDTLPPSLPPRLLSAPPSNVICDPKVLQPQAGYSGSLPGAFKRGGLARCDSDPRKRAKGGVTGKLLELRNEALDAMERSCKVHSPARTNLVARWETLRTAGHVTEAITPPDMASWLNTYTNTLATLKNVMNKEVLTWTISSAAARAEELAQMISKLDAVATSINVHVTAVEERVKKQRKAEKTDQRRAQGERTRLLSPWRPANLSVEGRVPLNLLRHMLDNGLLRPGYGTLRGHVMVDWHAADAPLLTTRPWLLAFSTEESGKDMGLLRSAIGERRIDEGIAKAEAFLEKEAARFSCDTRLVPMGGGQDSVEELSWVPLQWRARSRTPEALRSLGTPWLLSHDIAGARSSPEQWPMPGLGHFLSVQRGDMVACVVPAAPLLERGCSMHACVTFMCDLPSKNFESFVMTHCLFAELLPGRALWIPYGWRCILVTRTQMQYSHVLHIPYVSTRMLQENQSKNDIIIFAKQAMHEWGSGMGEPCLSLAKEANEWLSQAATLEDEVPPPAAVTAMAVDDVE